MHLSVFYILVNEEYLIIAFIHQLKNPVHAVNYPHNMCKYIHIYVDVQPAAMKQTLSWVSEHWEPIESGDADIWAQEIILDPV